MKHLLAAFAFCIAVPCAHAQRPAVSVTTGEISMPTYESAGRELQPPLFADSATGGLYPFPTYRMPLSATPALKTYKAIFVESDTMKLTYLPELGGRFMELYDKLNKREVFYKNDVMKPTPFNARLDWPQEGIELTGPFDVHSLTLKYDPYWSNTVVRNDDGSVSLALGEIDPFYGMKVTLTATLHPGIHGLQISVFCFNPNTSRMPQMFWTNAAFPTTDQTQFIYPMSRTVGHNTGEVTGWPMYQGVDYSQDKNNKNMLGVFGIDLYDNFGGAYMFDQDYGVFRYADRRVVQGMKMWTWGHGRDAEATQRSYTDKAGPYYEAQSGRHVWDGHYEWVAPHQVERWSEWWIPVAGTKGLATLTDSLALNLRTESHALQLDLSPVRAVPGARLTVSSSTGVLLQETVSLAPAVTLHRTIQTKQEAALHDVQVVVTDANGAELLHYRRPDAKQQPSEYTAFTRELEKPTRLPEQMSAEELVLAAEFRLKELDDAGALDLLTLSLKKDPAFSTANTLKGIVLYKQGKLPEAESALQAAVDRNPYADRAWYYLAVTQLGRGNRTAAERNLYYIWPDSAYFGNREYQLGRLNLMRGALEAAIEHLHGAIDHNAEDLSAHHLLATAYRQAKQNDLSEAECAALLRIDPTDRAAFAERYLRTGDDAARQQLKQRMGDQTQEALHAAQFYSDAERWADAVAILQLEAPPNSDPFGTSAVYFYTLAEDLQQAGNTNGAKSAREQAKQTAAIVDRFPYLPSSESPLRAAIAADRSDALAHFDLGCLLYSLNRKEEAVSEWQAAQVLQPKDFKVERVLGLAAAEASHPDSAITYLQHAVQLDPSHRGTVNDLVTQYARAGRFDDELKLLNTSIARADDRDDKDDLLMRLLQVDLVQARYSDAEQIVTGHTFAPRHRDTQLRDLYRALKYAEAGKAFSAKQYAEAAAALQSVANPPATLGVDDFQFQATPRLAFQRGVVHDAMGRHDEALQDYAESVKRTDLTAGDRATYNSDNIFILFALDRLERKAESDALAAKFAAFAESQVPLKRAHRQAEGHYMLALLAMRAGDATTAKQQMLEALRTEPDFLQPRFDLRADSVDTALMHR